MASTVSFLQSSKLDTRKSQNTYLNVTNLTIDSSCGIYTGPTLGLLGSIVQLNGTVTTAATNAPNSYSSFTAVVDRLFSVVQPADPSKSVAITTDRLFLYSRGNALLSGQFKPQTLVSTCTGDEDAQVFSFVQSQSQLPLSEDSLLANYRSQFFVDSAQNLSISDFQEGLARNFTYTVVALGMLNVSASTVITTPKFGAYASSARIEGTVDTSAKGCLGGQGLGKGKSSNRLCTATGGAYGGRGGKAVAESTGEEIEGCDYKSAPYGRFDSFAVLEGSGGGGISGSA